MQARSADWDEWTRPHELVCPPCMSISVARSSLKTLSIQGTTSFWKSGVHAPFSLCCSQVDRLKLISILETTHTIALIMMLLSIALNSTAAFLRIR
jgi:hypothetical protein